MAFVLSAGLLMWACPGFAQSGPTAPSPETMDVLTAGQQNPLEVHEGDILVDEGLVDGRVAGMGVSTRSIGQTSAFRLWPDGTVPFELHADLTDFNRRSIASAIELWNAVPGVQLVPRASLPAERTNDYLVFRPGDGCASWVGRRGGQQDLWLSPNCGAGSTLHEIGHVLGLEHEHTRPDRDQHIRILWENIAVDKRFNFDTSESDSQPIGAYDVNSIMHYGPRFFSANGQPTIEPIYGTAPKMGQRTAPSAGDRAAIATLYGADLDLVTRVPGADATPNELEVFVTNQSLNGAHDVLLTIPMQNNQALEQSTGDWQCLNYTDALRCQLARLPGEASSHLNLMFAHPVEPVSLQAGLEAGTPPTQAANQTLAEGDDKDAGSGMATAQFGLTDKVGLEDADAPLGFGMAAVNPAGNGASTASDAPQSAGGALGPGALLVLLLGSMRLASPGRARRSDHF